MFLGEWRLNMLVWIIVQKTRLRDIQISASIKNYNKQITNDYTTYYKESERPNLETYKMTEGKLINNCDGRGGI